MDQSSIGKLGNKVDESTAGNKVSRDQGAAGTGRQAPASPGDTVELTDGARLLERLEKSLADLPGVDAARVAEVKTAIENGEYEIDADAIADAMIRFERSLGE